MDGFHRSMIFPAEKSNPTPIVQIHGALPSCYTSIMLASIEVILGNMFEKARIITLFFIFYPTLFINTLLNMFKT